MEGFIHNLSETGDEQWKFAENTKVLSVNRKVLQGFKINEHKCKVMYMRKKIPHTPDSACNMLGSELTIKSS